MKKLVDHPLWTTYDDWFANNSERIFKTGWTLVDEKLLSNPSLDNERGINLISFLNTNTNEFINSTFVQAMPLEIRESCWFVPDNGRHVTILDIIPHNSGLSLTELEQKAMLYTASLVDTISLFERKIPIAFSGIFVSPDGITLQGFPLDSGLANLRHALRHAFSVDGLINLEKNKYILETAHVALAKFTKPLLGKILIDWAKELRKTVPSLYTIENIVLNISSRYDKTETIKIVKGVSL